jgi:threonine dehydratase
MLEPAGALALAGMKKYITQHDIEGRSFVAITSGANMKCKLHASRRVG